MASLQAGKILSGRTGASYHLQKVLYERGQTHPKVIKDTHRVWLAMYQHPNLVGVLQHLIHDSSNNHHYVVKPVTPFLYAQAFRLQKELASTASSNFVRLPVDGNDANNALVFQYYTEDFLSFMQSGPVSRSQVKRILLDLLRGIAACHSKDWVHGDVKPNNVLISYTRSPDGSREIHGVVLSDTESAAKVKEGEGIFTQVGNVLWRSPEAQTGTRVGKASDIWSFGVTAAYGITKMVIFAYDELEEGVLPEVEVLSNMLSYFGPLPEALVQHVNDSPWCQVLIALDQSFDKDNPRKPFSLWRDIDGLEAEDKEFLRPLLNLAPRPRPAAEELLTHPWFSSPEGTSSSSQDKIEEQR